MKRFSFRLERVRSFRANQRRQAALELEAKQLLQAALRNEDESIERNSAALREERSRGSDTTGLALRASEAYLDSLTARRRQLIGAQRENQTRLDESTARLLERDRQVKLLEKLRARRLTAHQRLEDREEQIQVGEQSLIRWRRSRA